MVFRLEKMRPGEISFNLDQIPVIEPIPVIMEQKKVKTGEKRNIACPFLNHPVLIVLTA
jgi:hypothetical protein